MNWSLVRQYKREDGIFSTLSNDDKMVAWCLSHAYPVGVGQEYEPKLYPGAFDCVRGVHHLPWHGKDDDPFLARIGGRVVQIDGANYVEFETFEITGVKGHSDILFHWGSLNKDSNGCELLGTSLVKGDPWMVSGSRDMFASFMDQMQGIDSFPLNVS